MTYVITYSCVAALIDSAQLLLLGTIAGLTIFLGLPMALLKNVSRTKKGFLNALAMGILIFLITDVLSAAWQPTKLAAVNGYMGRGPATDAIIDLVALFGGLGLGLLGLALYEQRYLRRIISTKKKLGAAEENSDERGGKSNPTGARDKITQQHASELFSHPHHLATMLAGGALIYVTLLMYNTARRESRNDLIMVGLFIGLLAGFLTDLIVSLGGA